MTSPEVPNGSMVEAAPISPGVLAKDGSRFTFPVAEFSDQKCMMKVRFGFFGDPRRREAARLLDHRAAGFSAP